MRGQKKEKRLRPLRWGNTTPGTISIRQEKAGKGYWVSLEGWPNSLHLRATKERAKKISWGKKESAGDHSEKTVAREKDE